MIPTKRTSGQLSDAERNDRRPRTNGNSLDHASLVDAVYQGVCEEFDEWSKHDFEHAIESLTKKSTRNDHGIDEDIMEALERLGLDSRTDIDHSSIQTLPPPRIITLEIPFEPTPLYTNCTPVSSNQFTGDDSSYMPFLPFADDPSFDWKEYCKTYKYFAWQSNFFDPNLHAIVAETAHRLHDHHRLSYTQIDETGVLPLSLTSPQGGIIRTTRYQGFLDWAGNRITCFRSPPEPSIPWRVGFEELVKQFCNSSSCMMSFCDQHIDWFPIPLPLPVTAQLQSGDLFNNVLAPCGESCFIFRVPGNMPSIETEWSTNDIDTLSIVLEYAPDTSPCDLAVICKKPCFEVFKRRKFHIPDQKIRKKPPQKKKRLLPLKFNDLKSDRFQPNPPCHHQGPCNEFANCACFRNKAHCERSCRCDPKTCRRRWPGCKCKRTKTINRPCGTDRCPCYKAFRECDPELCGKCEARDQFKDDGCLNVSIQRGQWKSAETKPGAWGFGLFLLEEAEPGELVLEYTGEIIYELTVQSRDHISRHHDRNYLFDLNINTAIDSEFAGNESRYINHSRDGSNCLAQVKMVNGDHRIGIYAKTHIDAGAELTLNYGSHFFNRKDTQ
ncbi:hypothetical protein BDP27DRAFT_1257959 [Rhodocollybia butyracea]|uniref:SET domain-containing protein n=1 Tax=Rhodocollybia butyracea TaxID=206335 RepID=A0A9P5Q3J0_9AGAR|nr:hypothetical protein BDP27DRAFT_1257959 [Rhodocollybia butyracea]